jgi:HlyD family secretion protein
MQRRKGRWWLWLAVALPLLMGAAMVVGAKLHPGRVIDGSKLAVVEEGEIARSVVATGKIEPRAKVEVKSKESGLVQRIVVDEGDSVRQGQVLVSDKEEVQARAVLVMTLGDVSEVDVRGKVDQADIGRVRLHQPARIAVESLKDRRFEGAVTKISPLGVEKDNVTTFEVRVSIRNRGGVLKAMMSANAEIIEQLRPRSLLIPEAAVLYDKDRRATAEVPDPAAELGKRRVPVTIGIANGVRAEVLAGLRAGERVVL